MHFVNPIIFHLYLFLVTRYFLFSATISSKNFIMKIVDVIWYAFLILFIPASFNLSDKCFDARKQVVDEIFNGRGLKFQFFGTWLVTAILLIPFSLLFLQKNFLYLIQRKSHVVGVNGLIKVLNEIIFYFFFLLFIFASTISKFF